MSRSTSSTSVVFPTEIRPGLWRWTAPHPDWRAGAAPGSPGDWDPMVGSVLYEATGHAVFIDPLVPEAMWPWIDERCRGRRVHVLTTIRWHRRSRDEFVRRYAAGTSRAKRAAPPGVDPIAIRGVGETMFWLPDHGTLIPGDRIEGASGGGLKLCPDSWMTPLTHDSLAALLRPLLELEIERVLVSHGEPVLSDGRRALEAALS